MVDLNLPGEHAFVVRPHHLLCAVCVVGGCEHPSCGMETALEIRRVIKADGFVPLRLVVDLDTARIHYRDLFLCGGSELPEIRARQSDYVNRMRDLEVMRRLGMRPNSVHPAADVVNLLFERIESLEGICHFPGEQSENWPECPHAAEDRYGDVRGDGRRYSLAERTDLGEALEGIGVYSLLPTRTRAEMSEAKSASCRGIEDADRLFILPSHLLCLLCFREGGILDHGPLAVDNVYEILDKIRRNPDIPVTLVDGICMVCDPCSAYDVSRNLCQHGFVKSQLRNLMVLRKLGLRPGDTLKARDLYALLFERISAAKEICGWGDMQSTSPLWGTCGMVDSGNYDRARARGLDELFNPEK